MGNSQSNEETFKNNSQFSQDEVSLLKELLKSYFVNDKGSLDLKSFQKEVLLNNDMKIIDYINSYYDLKKLPRKNQETISFSDISTLAYMLFKMNQNEQETVNCYFRKNSFLIIYDMFQGKIGSFSEADYVEFEIVKKCFELLIKCYINKHVVGAENQSIPINKENIVYNQSNLITILENHLSVENGKVLNSNLYNFIDTTLYNLDSFIKSYFREKFLNISSLSTSIPICTEQPNMMSIEQFFFFVLSNSLVYSKKYAFKLFDCKIKGFNILNLMYSFLGFGGPISIFIKHYDQNLSKEIIIGMYLNSNYKECYESYCGDDLSFPFSLFPLIKFYKYASSNGSNKICYINLKNQRYSKKVPGVGLGYSENTGTEKYKIWLDSNEVFKKSYFCKYDDVFEEGTVFQEIEQTLNVNIY